MEKLLYLSEGAVCSQWIRDGQAVMGKLFLIPAWN
jgi:hypothetical protein